MIQVKNLTKDYSRRRAIDNLTFDAQPGEVLGFLGPNGAGKTTTMRILTGYMAPTSGSAKICGFDIVDQSLDVRKRIGYLPENTPLYGDMTVYEYLRFMCSIRNVKKADERIDEVLKIIKIEDRADSPIERLSKGLRQRVGLAQAIIHDPEVLILDEPTIGLDPAQIIEVRNIIREIGKRHTVLLSTHILSEAQQLCQRILIINKGRIVAEDTTEHLRAHLSGSQLVTIRLKDERAAEACELIKKIPGILSAEIKSPTELLCESTTGQELKPEMIRKLVTAGIDLMEVRVSSLSLEDIFISLTKDEATTNSIPGKGMLI